MTTREECQAPCPVCGESIPKTTQVHITIIVNAACTSVAGRMTHGLTCDSRLMEWSSGQWRPVE